MENNNDKFKLELIKAVFYMDMVEGTAIGDELKRLFEVMKEMETLDFNKWVKEYKGIIDLGKWLEEKELERDYMTLQSSI